MKRTKSAVPSTLRTRIAAVLMLGGALLMGCQAEPSRDSAGSIAQEGDLSVFSFRVGDCFDDTTLEVVSDVPAVPCSDPHDNEVFHLFELPDGPWPGDAALEQAYSDECLATFETYVGTPYEESELYAFPFTPTIESWEGGDREVVCAVYADGEQLIGSVRGSGR